MFNLPKYRVKEIIDLYNASTSKLGNTLNERKIYFFRILKSYYPFFVECDYNNAYKCIYENEKNLQLKKREKSLNEEYGLQLINLFGKIDEDGNGKIDVNEFSKYFKKCINGDASSYFRNADKDGNGVLDLEEFIEFVCSSPYIFKNFTKTISSAQKDVEEERRNYLSSIFKILPFDEFGNPRRPSLSDILYDKII